MTYVKVKKSYVISLALIVIIFIGLMPGILGRPSPGAGDFMIHRYWMERLLEGFDPFEGTFDQELPRVVFPGEFLWLFPVAIIPSDYVPTLIFIVDFLLVVLLFWASQFYATRGRFGPWAWSGNAMVWFALFVLSQPSRQVFRTGNLSLISSVFIFFALLGRGPWLSGFCLSAATVLKFSIVPFYAFILLVRRHYTTCLVAFCLFAFWCLTPFFYDKFGVYLYNDFFYVVFIQSMKGGYNTYVGGGGFDLVNFNFLKFETINIAVKLFFIGVFCVATWRERNVVYYDVSYLLLVSCISSIVVYHRIHDLVLTQLFLVMLAQQFYAHRQMAKLAFPLAILIYMCIPLSWQMKGAAALGQWIGDNSWVYLGTLIGNDPGDFVSMFPIPAINLLIVLLYSTYAYFNNKRKVSRATSEKNGDAVSVKN